ncbi:PREDICTED: uncharacterized protein LOC101301013 [Fragaria vesca subsp. vesca]|uniref:uncharacterized protein LOC101301013 n=1 Tax=Fragaria vesca subsp. vesca TaxID=101020 RepID=UPI0002C37043|nr:PREDICTED: uncharacterized protein LOC101301013 [Fragaria vesca subsp. vesca]
MEKHQYGLVLTVSVVASLGVVSFVSCIAAETKRIREDEVKLVGRLCKLPESHAFVFGIAALICLVVAQVIGNLAAIRIHFCSTEKKSSGSKAKQPAILIALLFISWVSFVIAVTLISTATSMSRKQSYGEGWLDGECYLVKQGIYIGSGILVLVTVGSTLGLAITTMRKSQVEEGFIGGEQRKLNTKL